MLRLDVCAFWGISIAALAVPTAQSAGSLPQFADVGGNDGAVFQRDGSVVIPLGWPTDTIAAPADPAK